MGDSSNVLGLDGRSTFSVNVHNKYMCVYLNIYIYIYVHVCVTLQTLQMNICCNQTFFTLKVKSNFVLLK